MDCHPAHNEQKTEIWRFSNCPGMVRSKMKVFINTLNVGKCKFLKFLGLKAVSFLFRYLLWRIRGQIAEGQVMFQIEKLGKSFN